MLIHWLGGAWVKCGLDVNVIEDPKVWMLGLSVNYAPTAGSLEGRTLQSPSRATTILLILSLAQALLLEPQGTFPTGNLFTHGLCHPESAFVHIFMLLPAL